ncbi:MAG: general secretion pathway protein GspG [Mucilaginibacter sp. 44-25]|uniref:type IV pilin protein n=2 Tax=unclassified Mucilaginibacter TaxID=2617802 RepID=UPI00095E4A7B|nr:type II secretion system protein [Mucilaginibacter sp. MD40]OJW18563.1 MAG: general secretion pathway protein GspG [Mucilaginibacter sp. 44-25]PAW94646.1 general secretion pathway protein GspG [Mucilaginibacter sp. MD40]
MKPHHRFKRFKVKAFTLTEVLVVLVIIGILIFLALPSFMPLITRSKSTEAKTQLAYLQTLEESYFFEHSRYSSDLTEIGFQQRKLVSDDKTGTANYRIEITQADNAGFVARATSVTDFNGDGKFNVWEITQDKAIKEVTPD